jgi:hypothetical protein
MQDAMSPALVEYERVYRGLVDELRQRRWSAEQVAVAVAAAAEAAVRLGVDSAQRAVIEHYVHDELTAPACLPVSIDWELEPQPGLRLRPEFHFPLADGAAVPEIRMLLDEQLEQTGWTERPEAQRRQDGWAVDQCLILVGRQGELLPGIYGIQMMVRLAEPGREARCYQGWLKFRLDSQPRGRNRRFELVLDDSAASLEGLSQLLQADDVSVKITKSVFHAQSPLWEALREPGGSPTEQAAGPKRAECRLWPVTSLENWETTHQRTGRAVPQTAVPGAGERSIQINRTRRGVRLQGSGREVDDEAMCRLDEIVPEAAGAQAGIAVPARLAEFHELFALDLSHTAVTDRTVAHLAGLTGLRVLCLDGTQISDDGLLGLTALRRLQSISLAGTAITDRGLRVLRELPALEVLSVARTEISDAALMTLLDHPNLRQLSVRCCPRISDQGVSLARSRRPDLDIEY